MRRQRGWQPYRFKQPAAAAARRQAARQDAEDGPHAGAPAAGGGGMVCCARARVGGPKDAALRLTVCARLLPTTCTPLRLTMFIPLRFIGAHSSVVVRNHELKLLGFRGVTGSCFDALGRPPPGGGLRSAPRRDRTRSTRPSGWRLRLLGARS